MKLCKPRKPKAKILPFDRPSDEWERAMLELIDLNRQGKVTHFVGFWQLKDSPRVMHRNWWGESCFVCLGMATRIVEEINRWINGEVEE